MISEFWPTILFFSIILLVIFWIVYSTKILDKKLQNKLQKIFNKSNIVHFGSIEKEKRYLKKIGIGEFKNRKLNLYTNNNEALLNRQVIFEFDLNKEIRDPFVITRNLAKKAKNSKNDSWKNFIYIFTIPFSEMYNLGRRLQIALETLNQKKADRIFRILENSNLQNRLFEIPSNINFFGLKAFNSYWKIYCEKNFIGFEIESTWIRKISLKEFENFFEIINGISDQLENDETSTETI